MKIKLLTRYKPEKFTFDVLKEEYGIYAIRGPRGIIPTEGVQDIPIPSDDSVFFYDERGRLLYATKMADVVTYILELEPWDQVDACVFTGR